MDFELFELWVLGRWDAGTHPEESDEGIEVCERTQGSENAPGSGFSNGNFPLRQDIEWEIPTFVS